nr:NADH dehydrogenase subunit 4 [Brachionus falcatus]
MTFFVLLLSSGLFFSTSLFSFPVVLLIFFILFMLHTSMFTNQCLVSWFMFDEISLTMVFMMVFVLFISYIYSLYIKGFISLYLIFSSMLLFCFGVFSTNNLFMLYFFYESSLLPILYIIVKWGSYPERSLSAMMLLIYTSIFTFPFIYVMFMFMQMTGSFLLFPIFSFLMSSIGFLSSMIVFFTFAVKLPIYGLHFWLPMAHVEAPTFGSMILAGVLLKLGGVGLLRCSYFLCLDSITSVSLAYFMIFLLYVTVVCLFQSDFKRLVAYSSVSHMMAIPILLLSDNLLSYKALLMVMFFHGLSSPILFMLVGVIYSMFSSRQLLVVRGVILVSPLLSLLMILAFFFTLSAPPFPSFVSEVYFLMSSYVLSSSLLFVFIIFTFLSLVYNLNWLSSILFSRFTTSNMEYTFSYLYFMPLLVSFLFCIPIIFLMMLF